MRPFPAGVWLVLLAACLTAAGHTARAQKTMPEPGAAPPAPTAFPDLKPPTHPGFSPEFKLNTPEERKKFYAAETKYEEQRNALYFKDFPHELPKNPTPLQKVQSEQVRQGFAYLQTTREVIRICSWQPERILDLSVATEVYEVAAALEPTHAGKVRCYEVRVILLKEFEDAVRRWVKVGFSSPQVLNLAQAERLRAEVDLLKLKVAAKDKK